MMKQYLIIIVACMLSLHTVAQQYGSFMDSRDGKVYKTVKIGEQVWMAENLNVDRFRNGDLILHAQTDEEWLKACKNKQPAWCYDNNSADKSKYGKLYNLFAVTDERNLAPLGWHIALLDDWKNLRYSDLYGDVAKSIKTTIFKRKNPTFKQRNLLQLNCPLSLTTYTF